MKKIALILGGSGGVGKACAKKMAELNYNLVLVQRETKANQRKFESVIEILEKSGCEVDLFNLNVNEQESINKVSDFLKSKGKASVEVFIHAVADSNLGSVFGVDQLGYDDFVYTFSSMTLSFVNWSQMLVNNNYMMEDGRIIGFTSEGSKKVLNNYAAVGMAKAALETACKYMAVELAEQSISVNLLNGGVMDTRALRKLQDYNTLLDNARNKNPNKRLTLPEDIARAVSLLVLKEASWITGETIRVDGGEQLI